MPTRTSALPGAALDQGQSALAVEMQEGILHIAGNFGLP